MTPRQKQQPRDLLVDEPRTGRRSMRHALQTVTASRGNYWASYLIDLACPVMLGYVGWRNATDWPASLASLCAGAVAFSFVEYAIHRWLFHAPGCFMSAMHQTHHDVPAEPSALPCISSAIVALASWAVLVPIIGQQMACFFLCGFLAGYFWYGTLHHLEHHTTVNSVPNRWLQRKWAAHSVHHRLAHANFGVTTSFWDHVFGTHYQSTRR